NIMPASQINPIGAAMLNLFPLPNATDPSGLRGYNTQFQYNRDQPREDRILRVDYSLGSKTTSYIRLMQDFQGDRGFTAQLNGGGGWGQYQSYYDIASAGIVFTLIRSLRPNVINEFTWGINRAHQMNGALDAAKFTAVNDLSSLKGPDGQPLTLPHFFS